jgi:anti-anti-sigma regulatory factor
MNARAMELQQHADRSTLIVRGAVRLGEVSALLECARQAAERGFAIELDLREAEHMHAAAWQVLIALAQHTRRSGQAFRIGKPSESVAPMLEFLSPDSWLFAEENGD